MIKITCKEQASFRQGSLRQVFIFLRFVLFLKGIPYVHERDRGEKRVCGVKV
jgi:hypothetical protein